MDQEVGDGAPLLQAMAPKNLAELTCGIRFQSSYYWDPHPLVGVSSLFYAVPAATSLAVNLCVQSAVDPSAFTTRTVVHGVLYTCLAVLYLAVILTSALSDYIYIRRGHRSYFGKVDIRVASLTFFVSMFDNMLRAPPVETLLLIAIAMAAFLFSGASSTPNQWILRHTWWHAVGAAVATFGLLHHAPEEKHITGHLWRFVLLTNAAYAAVIAVLLAVWFAVPQARRRALWELGAGYADWNPVDGAPQPINGVHRAK